MEETKVNFLNGPFCLALDDRCAVVLIFLAQCMTVVALLDIKPCHLRMKTSVSRL